MPDWSFYRHMPVYGRGGRLIGRTEEIGHAVDYIYVQHGRVLVRDWYIPIGAVRDVTPQGIYLNVNRREMWLEGWAVPPHAFLARQGATPGYEYTTTESFPV